MTPQQKKTRRRSGSPVGALDKARAAAENGQAPLGAPGAQPGTPPGPGGMAPNLPFGGRDPDEEAHEIGKLSLRQMLMLRQFLAGSTFVDAEDKISAGSLQQRVEAVIGPMPRPEQ